MVVRMVMQAWFNGQKLTPIVPDNVASPYVYNQSYDAAQDYGGDPRHIIQKSETTFSLIPAPKANASAAITMRVALRPSRTSTSVDDVLLDRYGEIIARGALYRILGSPGKPYSNPQLAIAYSGLFERDINDLRLAANAGHTRGEMRVHIPRI
jgi:hypothetical protein